MNPIIERLRKQLDWRGPGGSPQGIITIPRAHAEEVCRLLSIEAPTEYREWKPGKWIGVDLDGTLAVYEGKPNWNEIGPPIPQMVERIQRWLNEGKEVRIFTARVAIQDNECWFTKEKFTRDQMVAVIQDYLEKIGLPRLEVTCVKDHHMAELWDDRCVQVIPNTGQTLADSVRAEATALTGKP